MTDPHKPLKDLPLTPEDKALELPETEAPQPLSPEGPLPGLPLASDPLMQPMPRPAPREVPPLD